MTSNEKLAMNNASRRMWHNSLSRSLSGIMCVACLSGVAGTLDIVNRGKIICCITSGTPEKSVVKDELKNIANALLTRDKTNKYPSLKNHSLET